MHVRHIGSNGVLRRSAIERPLRVVRVSLLARSAASRPMRHTISNLAALAIHKAQL